MSLDISDRYCNSCGQKNSTKRLSLYNYFGEFLTSVITYDSRIVHTIKDLFTKPGTISWNYVKGKRVRYANPFRFFLSVSIIFFLLNSVLNLSPPENREIVKPPKINEIKIGGYPWYVSSTRDSIKSDGDKLIAEYNYIAEEDLNQLSFLEKTSKQFGLFRDFYNSTEIKNAYQAMDSLNYESDNYNVWLYNRNKALDQIEEDPEDFLGYIIDKTPFYLFFLAPLLAFIFLLLYFSWYPYRIIKHNLFKKRNTLWYYSEQRPKISKLLLYLHALLRWPFRVKRKINYMEHLIFIFHIFTFVFLGLLLCLLPDYIVSRKFFSTLFLIIAPVYIYRALRNFYKQNRFYTIVHFLIINFVFLILGGISAAFFFIITAATY